MAIGEYLKTLDNECEVEIICENDDCIVLKPEKKEPTSVQMPDDYSFEVGM